jgi:hypothetical protein
MGDLRVALFYDLSVFANKATDQPLTFFQASGSV